MWSDYLVKYVKIYNNDLVRKGDLEKDEKEEGKVIIDGDSEWICNLFGNGDSNKIV